MNAPRTRVQRRPVHGVLLLDKPLGLSSNQALQRAKWLLRAEKAGHTGTLDPLATGVLPLCFGAATKFSQLHLDADKTYVAGVQLGFKTSTGDAEGDVIAERPVAVTADDLARVQAQFTGPIRQVPPMHSALKKDGKPLYEYAREGVEIERPPRDVLIHRLSLNATAPDFLEMEADVSKGTYIRTLGEDVGEALGCGAHLSSLRRTATGGFDLARCITLEALEALSEEERLAQLLPAEALVAGHTRVTLGTEDAARFLAGLRRRGDWADNETVAVFGSEPPAFLGTAHIVANELIPGRLLNPIEIQQILLNAPVPHFFCETTS
ncbi:tRNA pseudouridine(55) synthase TruB [Variovorax guangxiensis]|uniref:tRNA pseudouridine synthase B n=1 Tax=Variovorax guangxiensis TaxID=1775474 RepID=A0A502DYJ0_9BURK|nr:tRNA pseudouridine(55) synthase TruB [Variovorax guangxiensis]TPG26848.1 tRNA pseudouridine(55) synthase TruB [Variovorax ginsengisoli]TPG30575.1 tRNA pseudouridine(55) synthase TruB [Variovorax guangxiensis]